jgi:hypothetical protein
MKKLALILISISLHSLPVLATPLSDQVEAHNMNWLIGGTWKHEKVTLSYEWRLEKHSISVKLKSADGHEVEGMIVLKPGTDDIQYGAVDNKGGMTQGSWSEKKGVARLKIKHKEADGTEKRATMEHIKVDDNTLKLVLQMMDATGDEPVGNPIELELKKA